MTTTTRMFGEGRPDDLDRLATTQSTLITDILTVAHYARARAVNQPGEAGPEQAADAAGRILAAHAGEGLASTLLRQHAGALESRLVTFIRAEAQKMVAGG